MIVDNYNFNLSPYANSKVSVMGEGAFFSSGAATQKQLIFRMGQDANGFAQPLDVINYVHNQYGNKKPECLLDKLYRNLKEAVEYVAKLVSAAIDKVSEWISSITSQISELADEVYDTIVAPVLNIINKTWDAVVSVWHSVTNIITGGGC